MEVGHAMESLVAKIVSEKNIDMQARLERIESLQLQLLKELAKQKSGQSED